MSVSRIWASRRSPRPVFVKCFKDLLHRRCTGDLRRPVFAEVSGLPEAFPEASGNVSGFSEVFLQASDSNANVDGMHPNTFFFHGFHEGSRIKDKG